MNSNLKEFKDFLKLKYEEATVNNYISIMNQFFNEKQKFNQEEVNDFLLQKINKGLQNGSLNQAKKGLKQYSIFSKINIDLPKSKKEHKRVDLPFITHEELKKEVFTKFPLIFSNDWQKREFITELLFFTGLRLKELVNLKRKDFDLKQKRITIRNTKNKLDRVVPITDPLVKEIKSYFNIEPEGKNAFNINRGWVIYTFTAINSALNMNLSAHAMRRSFAKHLDKKGIKLTHIQMLLGHSHLETTIHYINPTLNEAISAYETIINRKKPTKK